jgi:hypothetical protein
MAQKIGVFFTLRNARTDAADGGCPSTFGTCRAKRKLQ